MAGHSKWHNIKHRKSAVDKKRSKMWSKCAKAIMVAAKNGGSDTATNLTLRYAIDEARYFNMPRETIERAVKKGAGELGMLNFEAIRYEGYGPGGAAIVIDALTDNRTRTAADIRLAFTKYGGNLGSTGCVSFMFETRGQVWVRQAGGKPSSDAVMEAAIAAGATDVVEPEEADAPFEILTDPTEFHRVKEAIEAAGLPIEEASINLLPTNTVSVAGEAAQAVVRLIDALEDNEDIQKVYTNAEMSEADVAAAG